MGGGGGRVVLGWVVFDGGWVGGWWLRGVGGG